MESTCRKLLQSIHYRLRCSTILFACLLASAVIFTGQAFASVDFVNQWPKTPVIVSNSAATSVSGIFKVGTGVNRLMVVAVALECTGAAPTVSVAYGGVSLNQSLLNVTGNNKLGIYYLNESGINSATNKNLSVTIGGTPGTVTATYATAAVFNGVDQTTPISNSGSLGITATGTTIGPVAFTAGNASSKAGNSAMSVYFTNWNNAAGETTSSAGYSGLRNYVGTNMSLAGAYKVITAGPSAESVTSTTTATAIGALAGIGINPVTNAGSNYNTITTCGDCHTYPVEDGSARNVPPGLFPGTHEKHAGGDDLQYGYVCTVCHYDNTGNYKHADGYKNITGSRLPGNAYTAVGGKKVTVSNSPTFGNCNNTICHSTGRSNAQFTPPTWGGSATTCLSCHAGRAGTGNGALTTSASGFKLSTTHSQHLKYPAGNVNCNICHSKTVTFDGTNLVLKQYTGVIYHNSGTANVLFTNIAYASYTSYKSDKSCTNVSCHGGKTRGSWQNTGAVNSDNTCVHCHGTQGTTTAIANSGDNRKFFAPGWPTNSQGAANPGISTDGNNVSSDPRVGGHFRHLSSAYMTKKIKCNECHQVPSNPFDAGHFDSPRYSSQTITFAQASTAIKNTTSPAYSNGSAGTAATCTTTYCHGSTMPKGDTGGSDRSPLWNQNLTAGAPNATTCGRCHGNPPLFGTSSSAHIGSVATTSCNGCHKGVVDGSGNIIDKTKHLDGSVTKLVDTTLTAACNKCHGYPPQGAAVKYGRYSGLVKDPKTLALGATPTNMGAHLKHSNYGLTCNACHNGYNAGVHPDNKIQIFFRISSNTIAGWNTSAQRAAYGTFSGNSPTGGTPADTTSSTLVRLSTDVANNSCNVYCHGGWTNSNRNMNPRWTSGATATTCGACHGTTPTTPPNIGSHLRHAGYSSASPTFRQGYSFACIKCHPNRTASNHVKGAVQVRFSTANLGANASYAKTGATLTTGSGVRQYQTKGLAGDTADGTCNNVYCHSTGRGTGMGVLRNTSTVAWGTMTRYSCLGCHAGRASAQGAPARSIKGFTLSTTHSQHLKYPAANVNCNECHSRTAADAATLKAYTGVRRHVNGVRDVTFASNATYGTYTSYKTSGVDQNKCANVSCHGGKTRGVWSATTTNNDNTCVHCHGTAGTLASVQNIAANRKFFAPGYNRTGTSTDQRVSSNDVRVGSHFKHLSSVYMKAVKCNECHTVPSNVFDGTHMGAQSRYNSQTLTFGQASTATITIGVASGSPLTRLASFAGYTSGTATKAATCSSVYCHGNRLKNGDTSGTYRKPYWNYSAMVNYTDPLNACSRCHGNPPTTGSAASKHTGQAATVSCYKCHPATVNSTGQIIDKTKHINGVVEFASHNFPYPGATHAPLAGLSPWSSCTGCHTNGSNSTYPVARGTAPDCTGCHINGLIAIGSGTSSCNECHGGGATDGRPNGAAFPNYSGTHTKHVVGQSMACSACHGASGGNIGDAKHGNYSSIAHTKTFVNVTSTSAQFHFTWAGGQGKGTCSTNVCHSNAEWGVTKLNCNGCHGYLATDLNWTTTFGVEGIGAHVKHINYLVTRNNPVGWSANDSYGSANFNLVCGTCHSRNPADHSMTKAVNSRNINFGGVTDRQFGASAPVYNGNASLGGTSSSVNPKSCSNIDCHFRTSPVWSTY